MGQTIFTKIINREIPAEIIYEDDYVIVIPDKYPSMEGQVLVITKVQAEYVFDLDDETYGALMRTTQKIARTLDAVFHTVRTCVVIEGFEVPHVHIRLYPCNDEQLIWTPRREADSGELKATADKIRALL